MNLAELKIQDERMARTAFWMESPRSISRWAGRRSTQNAYPCDVRVAWCDWVDAAQKSGRMTEALASKVTLA